MTKKGAWQRRGPACRDGAARVDPRSVVAGQLLRGLTASQLEGASPAGWYQHREAPSRLSAFIMRCGGVFA